MNTNEKTQPYPGMDAARVVEMIQTSLTRRGNGVDVPIRVVTQYWAKDGTLLAEDDPYNSIERRELQAKIRLLKGENVTLTTEIDETRKRNATLASQKQELEGRVARLEKLKQQAEARFAGLQDAALKTLRRNNARRTR